MENETSATKESVFTNRELAFKNHAELKLTPEEMEIVRDMNKKAFLRRTMPMTVGSMLLCQFLISRGKIGPSHAALKIGGCGALGFSLARMATYTATMARLQQEVPDGTVAQVVKMKHMKDDDARRDFLDSLLQNQQKNMQASDNSHQAIAPESDLVNVNTDYTTKTAPKGLDNRFKPDMAGLDSSISHPSKTVDRGEQKKLTSYAELREQARVGQQNSSLRDRRPPQTSQKTPPPEENVKFFADETETPLPRRKGRKNIYGDEME